MKPSEEVGPEQTMIPIRNLADTHLIICLIFDFKVVKMFAVMRMLLFRLHFDIMLFMTKQTTKK